MPATKTKKTVKTTGAKKAVKTPAPAPAPRKKTSALDAAAQVLAGGGSMTTQELIEAMAEQKLWTSPNGQTPSATLYSAILRELTTKGTASRFQKTAPGRFAATGAMVKAETTDEKPASTAKATQPKAAKGAKKKPATKKAEPAATEAPIPDGPVVAGTVPAA